MNIYQVLPRLFGNTQTNNNPNGNIEENGCGKLNNFSDKILKSIQKMGYTHVWYTGLLEHATKTDYTAFKIKADHPGIIKGQAGSPYAIKDYYDIDPDLAVDVPNRMQEFEALVERTHKTDLKMIIDFVPNHVAREYKSDAKPRGTKDLGSEDRTDWEFSSHNNFYYIHNHDLKPQFDAQGYTEYPAKATGNDQFTAFPQINDWYETIKLNYGVDYVAGGSKHFHPTPNTWFKMREILLFWAKKNVDGFRCDMAEMVPVEFWGWVIPQVKAKFPDVIFIAEVYKPNEYRNYIHHGKFDYLYDKVGMYDCLRNIICGHDSAAAISGNWQAVDDIKKHMLNFLENHDEQRIASDFFAGNPHKAIPAMIFLATFSASPLMVYSGQELGERGMEAEGYSGCDGRTTIFDYWSVESLRNWYNNGKLNNELLSEEQNYLLETYSKLTSLRTKELALQKGLFYDLMWANQHNHHINIHKQFAFFRKIDTELILVALNFDQQEADIDLLIPSHALEFLNLPLEVKVKCTNLLTGDKFTRVLSSQIGFKISIPAHNGVVLKLK